MRPFLPGALGLAAVLGLAGCGGGGDQTITAEIASGGSHASIVVSSDGAAIAKLKQDKSIGKGVTVDNGDRHSGALVCAVDVSSAAHKYHIAVYGDYPKDHCSASDFSSGLP
jgi:ABC-type sugar transport system ATPase subunit